MSAPTLFELTGKYRQLQALQESDDLPLEVIRDTIEAVEGELNDKALAVAHVILNLESTSAAIMEASAAMKARAQRVQNRADSLRSYLLYCLQSADARRIESAEVVIKRVNNPPSVQVTDEQLIPRQYWVQPEPPPERLDKKAIAAALKSGETIAGAFIESSERLDIRI